jgi:hypothetical protein
MAERLRVSGMSELDRKFEEGRMVVDVRSVVGMDEGWVFEGKWRGGVVEEEDMIAPVEDVGRGRKRVREDESGEMERKRTKVMPQEENKGVAEQRKERVIKHGKRKPKAPHNDADVALNEKTRNRGRAVDENVKKEAKRQRDDDECARNDRKRRKIVFKKEVQDRTEKRRERVAERAKRKAEAVIASDAHTSRVNMRKRAKAAEDDDDNIKRVR